jgi:uncharacterized protein YukE
MGAIGDVMALEDQEKLDRQAAAANAKPIRGVRVDGFRKAKTPTSAFPKGLKADGQFRVVPGQLTAVRAKMLQDLNRLQGALTQLTNEGAMGSAVGGWATADAFGSNALNAYEAITQFMQALNSAYDMVATNVGRAAQNYSDADATTAAAASQVGSEAAPGALS